MEQCDSVKITVIVDNNVDMLSANSEHIKRLRMDYHFNPEGGVVQADAGICLLVDTYKNGERKSRVLIDGGFESSVVLHNMGLLGIDPSTIEHVLLSHGHPDHFGGINGVLRAIGHKVPFVVHPDAFIPRSIVTDITKADHINRELRRDRLQEDGAILNETSEPVDLGYAIMTTGVADRKIDFEKQVPKGRFQIIDGEQIPDEIMDDTNVIINVKDKGLIVISLCGHSGLINTIKHAQKITGVEKIYTVIGGFHLGHPDIPKDKIGKTIDELGKMETNYVVPMHCSGLEFKFKMKEKMPEAFIAGSSATVLSF